MYFTFFAIRLSYNKSQALHHIFALENQANQLGIGEIDLSRPQRRLQHHHVGSLHPRSNRWAFYNESVYHEYLVEFPCYRHAGHVGVSGGCGRVVVAGSCDDGCWVYSCWDAGGKQLISSCVIWSLDLVTAYTYIISITWLVFWV